MFTGIIEGIGEIEEIRKLGAEASISVRIPSEFSDCRPGDSIAVDGACLTIVSGNRGFLTMDISAESLKRTTFGEFEKGSTVNLERALRLGDRLGGHIVTGHVDGTGKVEGIKKLQRSWIITIRIGRSLSRYLAEKGSITIDGISLTIGRIRGSSFEVSVIPLTAEKTTISSKKTGDRVNIEVDLISKYIERLFFRNEPLSLGKASKGIDVDMLIQNGFGGQNEYF